MSINRTLFAILENEGLSQMQRLQQLSRALEQEKTEEKPIKVSTQEEEFLDINAFNANGYTALMVAAWQGYDDCIEKLLAAGAKVNIVSPQGQFRTALMFAAIKGSEKCVRYLLNAKADHTIKDKNGHTAFLLAAGMSNRACLETLVRFGVDLNSRSDLNNYTALIVAAKNANLGNVEYLINAGADQTLTDRRGHSAQYHAYDYLTSEENRKDAHECFATMRLLCPEMIDSEQRLQHFLKVVPYRKIVQFNDFLMEQKSADPTIQFCLGVVCERHFRHGSHDEVPAIIADIIRHYEAAQKGGKLPVFAYAHLGFVYEYQQNYLQAANLYKLAIDNKNELAFDYLARLTIKLCRAEEKKLKSQGRPGTLFRFGAVAADEKVSKLQTVKPQLIAMCSAYIIQNPRYYDSIPHDAESLLKEHGLTLTYVAPPRVIIG